MPALETATEAPERKLEPLRVTGIVVPAKPLEGVSDPTEGNGGGLTEKVTRLLAPLEVVTVTFELPSAAPAATVKVAVIWEAVTTAILATLMPELLIAIVAPERKSEPIRVTVTALPCSASEGVTE